MPTPILLVATERDVLAFDPETGEPAVADGLDGRRPTCLATFVSDSGGASPAWCGTKRAGLLRSDDRGRSWRAAGLDGEDVTAVACDPRDPDVVWVGTEPSALFRTADGGGTWEKADGLLDLASSSEWSFPPKPETHHVRWIAAHPERSGHLWLAIEAGALVSTPDGGRTWRDRSPAGPWDTHELAIHPTRPEHLRVAAGDGYFEGLDGGATWATPRTGLDIGYLRSVAIDPGSPDVVVVSGATGPRSTYVAGRSDGRVYRRDAGPEGDGRWERITNGWPERPDTIAPLLLAAGEMWAADERGLHRSVDGGASWDRIGSYPKRPDHLRGLAITAG